MSKPIDYDDLKIWSMRVQAYDQDQETGTDWMGTGNNLSASVSLLEAIESHLKGHHGKGAVTLRFQSKDDALTVLRLASHAHLGFVVKLFERNQRLKELREDQK